MLTYIFPGQSSQKKGMGKELFDDFRDLTDKASSILGYSLKELCLEDPENKLGQTQFTQPALYIINSLSYLKKKAAATILPDFAAGHSLGEYSALFAAEVFSFETGLRLVKKRGEIMAKAHNGAMAAVIGLDTDNVFEVLKKNSLSTLDIANFNSRYQIVISGPSSDIKNAQTVFENAGCKLYIQLKVSGAFHSRYMTDAKNEFAEYLNTVDILNFKFPVIANVTARPYSLGSLKELLADQINHPVKWTESIRYLMGKNSMNFEEIGPGNVLTKLIEKIQIEEIPIISCSEQYETSEMLTIANNFDSSSKKNEIDIDPLVSAEIIDNNISNEKQDITATNLGSEEFKKNYNIKYAYIAGAMYRGVASKELVVKMGRSGFLAFLGTGGLSIEEIESSILFIKSQLAQGEPYGMNMLNAPNEDELVDLYLKHGINIIEAAAYMKITSALVRYRLNGLKIDDQGDITIPHKIIAKVSRPETAEMFMKPPPEAIIEKLLSNNMISSEEAQYGKVIAMSDDICAEADSGGHTDMGVSFTLIPAMKKLRDTMMRKYNYQKNIHIGAAGGIGTPEAIAAAFVLGADFVVTGSINQCTVESGTSDIVKDLLETINVQDTDYAPAGDMFEFGAKIQVLRKGVFFPGRANKLYSLYQHHNSIDEIDNTVKKELEEKYFKKSFESIFDECIKFYPASEIQKAQKNPKVKMAMIFKWYFGYSSRAALNGDASNRVDFQVHCGPALGSFNQWVNGTGLQYWKVRHVDDIAQKLMNGAAEYLNNTFKKFNSMVAIEKKIII